MTCPYCPHAKQVHGDTGCRVSTCGCTWMPGVLLPPDEEVPLVRFEVLLPADGATYHVSITTRREEPDADAG